VQARPATAIDLAEQSAILSRPYVQLCGDTVPIPS
jgi:hypothetical protein